MNIFLKRYRLKPWQKILKNFKTAGPEVLHKFSSNKCSLEIGRKLKLVP